MKNKTKNIDEDESIGTIQVKIGEGKYLEIKAKYPIQIDLEY